MIHKKGRKPYNSDVPRVAEGVPMRIPANDYISIQGFINSNDGFINEERLDKYLERLTKKGFISTKNIYELSPGDRMAYITKEGKWCSGGFIIGLYESNIVYKNPFGDSEEFEESIEVNDNSFRGKINDKIREKIKTKIKEQQKTKEYLPFLLYKGFNNAVFSLQGVDVYEFWYKKKVNKKEIKKALNMQKRVKFNLPKNPTYYPVHLLNDNNEEVIVFYGRDAYDVKRFINSQKYTKALENGWTFVDGSQGTNNNGILKVNLKETYQESDNEKDSENSFEEEYYDENSDENSDEGYGEEMKYNN